MIYASAVFRGGSLYETAEDNGVHRLLSQTMPKGTSTRSAEQIAEEIEGIGSLLSIESGYNTLRIAVSSLSADFNDVFAVLMDVAGNPVFPAEATERERESQIAAIRAEQAQPQLVARNLLRSEIYGRHPYGLNPLGREETVLKIAQTQLIRRLRECFVWPSAVFGFCGRFRFSADPGYDRGTTGRICGLEQTSIGRCLPGDRQFRKPAGHIPRRQASSCGLHRISCLHYGRSGSDQSRIIG